jgi:hypothetical protein
MGAGMGRESEVDADTPRRRFVTGRGLAHALTESPIIVVLWLGAILHAALIFGQIRGRVTRWDFSHYYLSALAMRAGLNPYTTDLRPLGRTLGIEGIGHATYPPGFLLCFEPLTLMTPRAAYWTWFGINVAALALALVLLFRESPSLRMRQIMALIPLAILYPPLATHFFYAQTQVLILLLFVLMMWAMGRGYDRTAGLFLALAGLIKIFPLLMVGYFVTRHRWRAVAYTAAGVVAGALVTIAMIGVQRSLGFMNGVHSITSNEFIERPANIALGPFVSRLFWYASGTMGGGQGALLGWVRPVVALAAQLLLLGLTARATWAATAARDADWRAFSLWVVATILLAPTAWIHYAVLLLIPFGVVAAAGWASHAGARAVWLTFASYALLALAMAIEPRLEKGAPLAAIVVDECAFISVLLAYCSAYSFATGAEVIAS